ncbi:hypothetical protein FE415_07450 [Leuconostoc carnosum]|uniref:hypothetical protein n=1 Tax=Leuconostoc carnosum TaxID=1252 RepID=UPI00123B56B7|nr:hypothetical protein [Leuconostoc carnosum]KAA8371904.1 hypothetical protein FE415_07450 [Leuconostoc carnosum]KAA8373672.1 hypothetical protein FE412_01795 [Leuconostoc carnosum]
MLTIYNQDTNQYIEWVDHGVLFMTNEQRRALEFDDNTQAETFMADNHINSDRFVSKPVKGGGTMT